ncbi:TRAP transporter substrate-binding protein [Azospirillum endophyticum]
MRAFWGAALCVTMLMAAGNALAQEKLRLGHVLAKGSQFSEAVRVMNEELQRRTNGRYVIEEHPASVLGSGPAMLDGVKLGTIDMVMSSAGGALSKFNPKVGILDIALLFRDEGHADAVLDGPIGTSLLDTFKDQGVVGLAWGENGFRQLTNSLRPIKTPADLKGMKIRIAESELYKQAFETLGAQPFTLAFAQLYPALKSGQAEAEENPVTTIVSSKLQEVQSHITLSYHTYAPAAILINKELFDELPPDVKTAFVEAAKAGGKASRAFVRAGDKEGMKALQASGITITPTAQFDRAAFEQALQPFYAEMAKQFTAEKIQEIKAYK